MKLITKITNSSEIPYRSDISIRKGDEFETELSTFIEGQHNVYTMTALKDNPKNLPELDPYWAFSSKNRFGGYFPGEPR